MTWADYELRNAEANRAYELDHCPVCHGIPTARDGIPMKPLPDRRMWCQACKPVPIKENA